MPMLRYIDAHKAPADIYLIPNRDIVFDKFRLETGAPAFVNWKSHPYKDLEVLEWSRRNDLADKIYAASAKDLPALLDELHGHYQVTHLIAKKHSELDTCPLLKPVFSDLAFTLYRIETTPD
jgi:hypothetical protein